MYNLGPWTSGVIGDAQPEVPTGPSVSYSDFFKQMPDPQTGQTAQQQMDANFGPGSYAAWDAATKAALAAPDTKPKTPTTDTSYLPWLLIGGLALVLVMSKGKGK